MRGYKNTRPPGIIECARMHREPGETPTHDTIRLFDALVGSFDQVGNQQERDEALGWMVYELTNMMSEESRAGSDLIVPKAAQPQKDDKPGKKVEMRYTKGLATPERPKAP